MTGWDILTWTAVGVLAVGALLVFGFFLRDVRRTLREMNAPDDERGA